MKKNTLFLKLIAKIERMMLRYSMPNQAKGNKPTLDTDVLLRIDRWAIDNKWAEDKTMAEVADELKVKRQELSLFFRVKYGQSFRQWRKTRRIEEAKKMLLEKKDIPASVIGEAVGIEDKSNFRRQFKEITGCTPTEWRLKH